MLLDKTLLKSGPLELIGSGSCKIDHYFRRFTLKFVCITPLNNVAETCIRANIV